MNKKQLIFNSVLEISDSGSLIQSSISKIASGAGVANGTIYRYFDNKDHLLLELYNLISHELYTLISNNFNESQDIKENIYSMWKAILSYYLDNPLKVKYKEEFITSYSNTDDVVCNTKDIYALLTKVVHKGVSENVIKDIPCSVMTSFILGPITKLFMYQENGISTINESTIEAAFSVLWDGIKVNTRGGTYE